MASRSLAVSPPATPAWARAVAARARLAGPGNRLRQHHLPVRDPIVRIWIELKPSFWMPRVRVGSGSDEIWGTRADLGPGGRVGVDLGGLLESACCTSAATAGSDARGEGEASRQGERGEEGEHGYPAREQQACRAWRVASSSTGRKSSGMGSLVWHVTATRSHHPDYTVTPRVTI